MQQFVIPQFIDVEDKIIGPITTRQFVILLSAAIVLFILYKLTTFTFFLIFGFPTFAIGIVLAFIKINGQPFHFFLLNLLQTSRRPNLRVWNKELTSDELLGNLKKEEIKAVIKRPIKDVLEETKLSELSLIVNTGGAYRGEEY
ncbi:MAG TPA: PrgI family protein [Patescibacteria group bacterium]|nr:PrgI family protein [Patescibacteria group bacterium]